MLFNLRKVKKRKRLTQDRLLPEERGRGRDNGYVSAGLWRPQKKKHGEYMAAVIKLPLLPNDEREDNPKTNAVEAMSRESTRELY